VNATKLNDWMQVVGIFAVVASLIFVGLEMRQAQEISMSQAYQSRAAAVVEWDSAFAANPAALSASRKAADGAADEITPEEYGALRYTLLGVFNLYDNAHYQYQKGFVSQEFWDMTRGNLKSQMMNSVANDIFLKKVDQGIRSDFRDVVLKISKELEAQPDK
jgi:hypothetical protein